MSEEFPWEQVNPHAKIIRDSISPIGMRLTTFVVTFHRFVLAEFNTHRAFSRSSASSRAIPAVKQLRKVAQYPAVPVQWTSEQPGMQGGTELEGKALEEAQRLWIRAHSQTVDTVGQYIYKTPKDQRLHKSLLNRMLEPYMWHTVIVTSTDYENFFEQRCSPLAQPEIRVVAELMEAEYRAHVPKEVEFGMWDHTPFVDPDEAEEIGNELLVLAISAARSARVSYLNHDGVRSIKDDLNLYLNRLMAADPKHWAPLEMVAAPHERKQPGNFNGFAQLRHDAEVRECVDHAAARWLDRYGS